MQVLENISNSTLYICSSDNCNTACIAGKCISQFDLEYCQTSKLFWYFYLILAVPTFIAFLISRLMVNRPSNASFYIACVAQFFWPRFIEFVFCDGSTGFFIFNFLLGAILLAYIYGMCQAGIEDQYSLNELDWYYFGIRDEKHSEMFENYPERPFRDINSCAYCLMRGPYYHDPITGAYSVIKEMCADKIGKDELNQAIVNNVISPPIINIEAWAYHENRRRKNRDLVITKTHTEIFPYETWQETSTSLILSDNKTLCYHHESICDTDADLHPVLMNTIKNVELQMQQYDTRSDSKITYSIPGFKRTLIASDGNCFVSYCTSWFNKGIYFILALFGYHFIVDTIWRGCVTQINGVSKRQISTSPNLRAKANEKDIAAQNNLVFLA